MSTCLVTGGAGFIGSHLTDKLIELDHEVKVVDKLTLGKKKFINDEAEFYQVDLRNFSELKPLFEGADVVFHLAAEPRMQITIEKPVSSHNVNVTGTLNVLEAAKESGVDKVVFSSSCAIYGEQELPITEDSDPDPESPYGLHKLMGEQYCRLYSKLHDLPTINLRYFNVFGPRKLAEGGYPMVIPIFLDQKQKDEPLTIVGDGKQTRDYVHVSDVVKANIKAWQSEITNGKAFNIGSGIQVSVNEIADIVGGETTHIPERPGEMRFIEADISKATEKLDWEPQVEFEAGLNDLMEHWGVE